jgi:hypothetical protein
MAYMLAHKGKATASETTYNPDDPPEAYNNPSIHSRFTTYAETGRQIHGPEWDPIRAPFDGETVMRIGGGEEARPLLHGRQPFGHGQYSHSRGGKGKGHRECPSHTPTAVGGTSRDGAM